MRGSIESVRCLQPKKKIILFSPLIVSDFVDGESWGYKRFYELSRLVSLPEEWEGGRREREREREREKEKERER